MNRHSNGKNVAEKKIEQKLLRLMPGLPQFMERLVGRFEHFDGSEPKTLIAATRQDFDAFSKTLRGKEYYIGRLIYWLLGHKLGALIKRDFVQVVASAKQEAAVDSRYSLLLKLMHKVDEQAPLLSLVVSLRHADPESALDVQCRPMRFLQEAECKTGESRSAAVLQALAITAEALYRPYVITVWQLSYLKEGKLPPSPPDFGPLLDVAYQRLSDYPGLIEPDAVWARNAAVHQHYEYIVEEDALIMWDKNRPRTKVSVDALFAMVQRMYLISSSTIARVSQLYMLRALQDNGLLDVLVEGMTLVFSGDQTKIVVAEQQLTAKAEQITEPMRQFFASRS